MPKPGEVADIYTASMVQGLARVTFPAASTVLTSQVIGGVADDMEKRARGG